MKILSNGVKENTNELNLLSEDLFKQIEPKIIEMENNIHEDQNQLKDIKKLKSEMKEQSEKIDQLRNESFTKEIDQIKEDFILMKKEVFEIQQNQNKIKGIFLIR